MIVRLAAALLRLIDGFFPPTVCAHCHTRTNNTALWCSPACQRSWDEA